MRHNFSTRTKKAALARSGGRCEAVGSVYGLSLATRCTSPVAPDNVEMDHWPIPATDEGSDGLENCVACCKSCHAYKTAHYDVPMQAKGRRIRRSNGPPELRRKSPNPIRTRPANWPKRSFPKRQSK